MASDRKKFRSVDFTHEEFRLVVKWTWTNKQNKIHNDEPYVRM